MRKGKTNNPNGRPKGKPNKITKELRNALKTIVAGELEGLIERLEALEPEKRLDVIIKLLPYCLPKVEPVSASHGEPLDLDW